MRDLVGTTFGGYEVVEKLGRGGMANVYKAFDPRLKLHRALKIIRPDLAGAPRFQERFEQEAQAIAQLRHPHIVQMHHLGQHEELFYMVMEFVEGEDLKTKIERQGAIRPFSEAVRILDEIASALAYAHKRGILHRDVKPANILLNSEGEAILTDFGIAKILESDSRLTQTGTGIGTPAYMAPEQARGDSDLGPSCDLYAAGVVLFEMLTGRAPYTADTPLAVIQQVINDDVPPPRRFTADIPDALQGVVMRAMAKKVSDRYPSADALVEAARAAVAGISAQVVVPPTTLPTGTAPEEQTESTRLLSPTPPGQTTVPAAPPAPPGEPTAIAEPPPQAAEETTAGASTVPQDAPPPPPPAAIEPPPPKKGSGARSALLIVGLLALLFLGALAAVGFWGWNRFQEFTQEVSLEELSTTAPGTEEPQPDELNEPEPDETEESAMGEAPQKEEPANDLASVEEPTQPESDLDGAARGDLAPMGTPPSASPPSRLADAPPSAPSQRSVGSSGSGVAVGGAAGGASTGELPRFGGTIRWGRSFGDVVEPEEELDYEFQVVRPTTGYFDIEGANRRATYTLFGPDGTEIFRQRGADYGPMTLSPGVYVLRITPESTLPLQFSARFVATR